MWFTNNTLEVKRVGSTLIAGFHKAKPPLIWSFDLERNHSFTLALQGEEGDWELGVTSPKGDFYSVTRFLSREDADEAFARVQKALMTEKRSTSWLVAKIAAAIAGFLVLMCVLLAVAFAVLQSRVIQSMSAVHAVSPAPMVEAPAHNPEAEPGVPVPADEFLKAPH